METEAAATAARGLRARSQRSDKTDGETIVVDSSEEIPDTFDVREAFPDCAPLTGRIRDQSDCGSCWAFASTEAFNDRRCIAGITKDRRRGSKMANTDDQLVVLSAEDTTACCWGFSCGLR